MEFVLAKDALANIPAEIQFNYDELKKELSESLKYYQELVVTKESIKDAKKDRANLNNLTKALEDKRKQIKKQCLMPYEEFEKKVKDLVGMIKQPVDVIDSQVKAYEEIEKNEKYAKIESHYNEHVGDLSELITLEKVIPEKWENAGTALKKILESIDATLAKVRADIRVIRATRSAYEQNMLDVYLKSFDMSAALAENVRLEEQQAALERQRLALELQKTREEAEPKVSGVPWGVLPDVPSAQDNHPDVKDVRVIFYATSAQFRAEMKELCQKHNVEYGSV